MKVRFLVFLATSLDGFIARPDDGLAWLSPFEQEEHGYRDFFAGVDALVIGRRTYEVVLGFPDWPYAGKRVIVCTSRPASPAHGEELWSGSPRALAERLDREGVGRVYLDGGALICSFLREGLVDDLTLNLIPVLLGAGVPLFAGGLPEVPLRLVEARPFSSGLVRLRYARAPS
jgi:dihydrofolate reductase